MLRWAATCYGIYFTADWWRICYLLREVYISSVNRCADYPVRKHKHHPQGLQICFVTIFYASMQRKWSSSEHCVKTFLAERFRYTSQICKSIFETWSVIFSVIWNEMYTDVKVFQVVYKCKNMLICLKNIWKRKGINWW